MSSHRDEALKALDHALTLLVGDHLDPLSKRHLVATLDHARENVVALQEVKRKRKEKGGD